MKIWFVILAGVTGLLSPFAAFAAKDSLQIRQQEQFVKEKRVQEAELAQLRARAAEAAAQTAAAMEAQR